MEMSGSLSVPIRLRRENPFPGPAGPRSGHHATALRGAPTLVSEMTATAEGTRTYEVRTYGCQMNVHDSERLSGLLESAGYARAGAGETADVVVFNTCAVRENADNRLYGNLGHLRPAKLANPGMQIA